MTLRICIALIGIVWGSHSMAQSIARVENISITSEALGQEREILVYTPVDYDWRTYEHFNVIYVFDSHNREFFDYTSSIISFLTDASKEFIVVGISSPYNEALDYARNNDLLPELTTQASKDRYGKYAGNADHFLTYVATEVMPYINDHYRSTGLNMAVGHSLSASFILYSLVKHPNLFDNYLAISPNLAYDDELLTKALIGFDYTQIKDFTYLYLSHANEGIDYWKEWKPAREKLYSFFENGLDVASMQVETGAFPAYNHWSTFPPALNKGLEYYFQHISEKQQPDLSEETYEVSIRVQVPNENDTLYITGNQPSLGNWNPAKVQMRKITPNEREITLSLKGLAQFKFTRGDWSSEAEVIGTYANIMIDPSVQQSFSFEIEGYFDQ